MTDLPRFPGTCVGSRSLGDCGEDVREFCGVFFISEVLQVCFQGA